MRVPTNHRASLAFGAAAMTPLIDIVFQLLIFFICASTGHLREFLLRVDFSAGATTDAVPPQVQPLGEVWIRLIREGDRTTVAIEGTRYPDWDRVRAILRELGKTAQADADAARAQLIEPVLAITPVEQVIEMPTEMIESTATETAPLP
ncbi:MAG: hypothetical protein B7Z55_11290 [Planctomycetales bacterium 12-60-4]|nr:MAG: hypothetical protein B7Z55_11290 [Planctomycetales bacterium 12-60-4]